MSKVLPGFHYLPGAGEDDQNSPLPVSVCLDLATSKAFQSPDVLVRPYFKGRMAPVDVVSLARPYINQGRRIVLGNEPNLDIEQFGGGPEDYWQWFEECVALAPDALFYSAAPSPGVPGWKDYYWHVNAHIAKGRTVHAYGTIQQIKDVCWEALLSAPSGQEIWLTEFNWGAGNSVDINDWAESTISPLHSWLESLWGYRAMIWFAWRWPHPDSGQGGTPVDAAGTAVERIIREIAAVG